MLFEVLSRIDGFLAANQKAVRNSWVEVAATTQDDEAVAVLHDGVLDIVLDALPSAMTEEDFYLLVEEGLLANGGVPVTRTVGGGQAKPWYGVLYDALKEKVRDEKLVGAKVRQLERENKNLKKTVQMLEDDSAADERVFQMLDVIAGAASNKSRAANVVRPRLARKSSDKTLAGIPTLFLSDIHYGEVVDLEEVRGVNEYNMQIANRRLDRVFNQSLELLFRHQSGQRYDGMVVALGGDMFSGDIHEELSRTNAEELFPCVLDLAEKLASGIRMMAAEFAEVVVPCVVGNHGRTDKKMPAKRQAKRNVDWLLYQLLLRLLRPLENVYVKVSPAADYRYNVYNTRYLLTHGNQIRGGSGVGGFWVSAKKTDFKKRDREMKAGQLTRGLRIDDYAGGGYDYLMFGHFHTYGAFENFIANGSVKGIDEFSFIGNFGLERPQQAMWVTHPTDGITQHIPVFCEESASSRNPLPSSFSFPDEELIREQVNRKLQGLDFEEAA